MAELLHVLALDPRSWGALLIVAVAAAWFWGIARGLIAAIVVTMMLGLVITQAIQRG